LPEPLLTFRASVEYEESLQEMRSADGLLIIDAPFEQSVFFPSKLVDYLWARRPILALTPPGTSANIVMAAGGLVASPENPETIASGLADMIQQLRAGSIGPPKENVVLRYDARKVAGEFDRVVKAVMSVRETETFAGHELRHLA
jgi:hypothetical protein